MDDGYYRAIVGKNGYLIHLDWVIWIDEYGIKHRIGRYTLMQKTPVETINESGVA